MDAYQQTHATEWTVGPNGAEAVDGQMTPQIMMQYSQAIANAYINYLGTAEAKGTWPSYSAINQIHWDVNQQFGMYDNGYAATPFGALFPDVYKWLVCPKCAP